MAKEGRGSGKVRLPPGRHGIPRDVVEESQRERILNGVVEAVARNGYNATTIGQLVDAATVSRRTFYEHFSSKEECFLAAYEMIAAHLRDSLLQVPESEAAWPERLRAELEVLLGIFANDPLLARFCLIEPLAAGGEVADRYRAYVRCIAGIMLRHQSAASKLTQADADAREQVLVGGVASLLARRVGMGDVNALEDMLPDLLELALTPYLGRDEAQKIARSPAA